MVYYIKKVKLDVMKRRSFIKEITTVVTGSELRSVSYVKSENNTNKRIFNVRSIHRLHYMYNI